MSVNVNQIQNQKKNKEFKGGSSLLEFLNRDISLGKAKLSDKRKERFYSELSVLINSGIDLASSLEIIVNQEKNKKIHQLYESLLTQLIRGESFSKVMEASDAFTGYEYYSIMIGEESGTLPRILNELAVHYKTRLKQRRQITGALTYPIVVLSVAVVAVVFMLNVIVPMFAGVFQRFGGDLPPITQKIMRISAFFSDNALKIFLIIGLLVALLMYIRRFDIYRKYSNAFILKLPIFGELTRKIFLSRFCNTLQLLVASRAPLISSLELIDKMIKFYPLNEAIKGIKTAITHGKSLNHSMSEYAIFDTQIISLIKVGEETGKLEQILSRLYENYTEEIQYRTGQMGNLLEPFLILGVGAMVLVILIAMYLPLFQLSTTII